jgi:hypothetical protein
VLWSGKARMGTARQVRRGSLWFVVATSGMEGFVKAGWVRRGSVWYVEVRYGRQGGER